MPDIDPAALSRTGSGLPITTTPIAANKTLPTPVTTQKTPKAATMGQRIDLEPIYKELKTAIGEYWLGYKEATSLFVLGLYILLDLLTLFIHRAVCSSAFADLRRLLESSRTLGTNRSLHLHRSQPRTSP